LSNLVALVLVVIMKVLLLGTTHVLMQSSFEHLRWFLKIVLGFAGMSYGTYGFSLPWIVTKSMSYTGLKTIAFSGLLAVAIFFYLFHASTKFFQNPSELRRRMKMFVWAGLAVFVLAFTVFLLSENASVTPTGINNRFTAAATIGTAVSMIGAIGWIISLSASVKARRLAFCILVSLLCVAGLIINHAVGGFWITAYANERQVLSDIRQKLPEMPAETTLILDGVCPYAGPGIVFESNWDLAGALKTVYHDPTLKADIVRPTLKITKDGVRTTLYGEEFIYPYQKLLIYDFRRKMSYKLTSRDAARAYFERYDPFFGIDCPDGIEGFGVPIF